jgi:serine beta-lactamase-like protein LACTB, mitochondrial
MSKGWKQKSLTGISVLVGLIIAAFVGLNVYIAVTTKPMHPDPTAVPAMSDSAPSQRWADAAEQGRQIARAGVSEQNLPGLSVAVGVGGEIVWAEGFGWADIDKQTRVTPATQFRAGEVSKALTSAAAGLLVEQRKLNLDAYIQTYVPDFPEKQWPVTLQQLMAQVAGFRDDAGDEASLEPCAKTEEGLSLFADDSLLFEPGTKYKRSSYSWILVSAAIEAAAHEPFFGYMRSAIFEPLRMTATRPDALKEQIADRATFYFPRFSGDTRYGPESVREGDHSCYAGGGAFLSTPSDLVRFGIGVGSGTLLTPATVRLLQTPQRLASGEETGYGLGWSLETLPLGGQPTRMAGHGIKSDFIGGTASLMTFPDRGIVVAVMTNISFADTKAIALKIAETFAPKDQR